MTNMRADGEACLSVVTKCDLWQIRNTLAEVQTFLHARGLPKDWVGNVNLVLTEAMTNIVRHGGSDPSGEIRLTLSVEGQHLNCILVDTGVAFDPTILGHSLPNPGQLKEGGYGWFIIRKLSKCLRYSHENGRNSLSFILPLDHVQHQN